MYTKRHKANRETDASDRLWKNLNIAIVGGGLSGLAAALALQNEGMRNITVYERDNHFHERKQGYGLTLTKNFKGPLAALGVLPDCLQHDCPSICHWALTSEGKVLGFYGTLNEAGDDVKPFDPILNAPGTRGNLRVPRQDLRHFLLQRLSPGTIRWGHALRSFTEDPDGVTLHWHATPASDGQDGTPPPSRCDVLVGADGVRSVVRALRDAKEQEKGFPVAPLQYLRVAVILGISSYTHALVDRQGFYVLGSEQRLFTMPFRPPSDRAPALTMWQLSFRLDSVQDAHALRQLHPAALLQEAQRRTTAWPHPAHALVAHTALGEVWATPLFDRDPAPLRARDSRVCVVGDAAHPMSMFKGQGANMAMEDGPLLAAWLLTGKSNTHKAATHTPSAPATAAVLKTEANRGLQKEGLEKQLSFTQEALEGSRDPPDLPHLHNHADPQRPVPLLPPPAPDSPRAPHHPDNPYRPQRPLDDPPESSADLNNCSYNHSLRRPSLDCAANDSSPPCPSPRKPVENPLFTRQAGGRAGVEAALSGPVDDGAAPDPSGPHATGAAIFTANDTEAAELHLPPHGLGDNNITNHPDHIQNLINYNNNFYDNNSNNKSNDYDNKESLSRKNKLRNKLYTRLRCFEREMVAGSAAKVGDG
jgi:2-polyprenyl-6-methoxyphenol hydroxylase-like FAD-dependent oxidoreductase